MDEKLFLGVQKPADDAKYVVTECMLKKEGCKEAEAHASIKQRVQKEPHPRKGVSAGWKTNREALQ